MPELTAPPAASSLDVRSLLVDTLRLDLIGPDNGHAFADELLPERPTRWYLTGFLTPTDAPMEHRFDETSPEEIDSPAEPGGLDDDANPDRQAASAANRRSLLPSSMGLSVLIPADVDKINAQVLWGDYAWQGPDGDHEPVVGVQEAQGDGTKQPKQSADGDGGGTDGIKSARGWRRTPHTETVAIDLPAPGDKPSQVAVPDSGGLVLVVTVRTAVTHHLPDGTKAVSVFLVNSRSTHASS